MFKRIAFFAAVLVVLSAAQVFAMGFGHGGNNYGGGNTGFVYNICSGTPETITGTVISYGIPGNGLELKVGNSLVNLYGVGPYWYWESKNVDMPEIGETVTAVISSVTTAGYKVILRLTIGSDVIDLRDPATCQPLWRGGRGMR